MLIDELELDSFRVRCKFPKSIMMNLFIPLTSKYEHRFHIKCDDIRIHVVDETYDGEFMNLYYETDDDERDRCMERIFEFLDGLDEQYALFGYDYAEEQKVPLNRIQGALIWKR